MPDYRRARVPGGIYFLTLVTYRRTSLFSGPENVARLRSSLARVRRERPFEILAAVLLPDHLHFLWALPPGDASYSWRVGRMKALFTRSLRDQGTPPSDLSPSRRAHREGDVWQRHFWEHAIRDEADFESHLNYIHYNPVRHGLVTCPHLWPNSSFARWVSDGFYDADWGCECDGRRPHMPDFALPGDVAGE